MILNFDKFRNTFTLEYIRSNAFDVRISNAFATIF